MNFQELGLAKPILRAVADEGYTQPTPIQAQSIPHALEGADLLACAQTGTGKTCAFALPILQILSGAEPVQKIQPKRGPRGRAPRALVLCPTRELACQILDSFEIYGANLPLDCAAIYGGVNQFHQVRAMRAGVDILAATPGRLLDLMNQGHIDLGAIEILVLDEADRMLDMGFMPDIKRIVQQLPEERQTMLFSATLPKEIRRLAGAILHEPVTVETTPESTTVELVSQRVHMVEKHAKPDLLESLLRADGIGRTLVFTRTKHGADKVVRRLRKSAIHADAIHGNKSQGARTRALEAFRSGRARVLVATDIASRGIDVDEITHVINYDMPVDAETYVHRVGRTARAGASGVALTFCGRDEVKVLRDIERRTKIRIDVADAPKGEKPSARPAVAEDRENAPRPRQPEPKAQHAGGHKSEGHTGAAHKKRRSSKNRGGRSRGPGRGASGQGGGGGRSRRGRG